MRRCSFWWRIVKRFLLGCSDDVWRNKVHAWNCFFFNFPALLLLEIILGFRTRFRSRARTWDGWMDFTVRSVPSIYTPLKGNSAPPAILVSFLFPPMGGNNSSQLPSIHSLTQHHLCYHSSKQANKQSCLTSVLFCSVLFSFSSPNPQFFYNQNRALQHLKKRKFLVPFVCFFVNHLLLSTRS